MDSGLRKERQTMWKKMQAERWSDESRNKQMTVLLSVYCLCNACCRLKGRAAGHIIEISLVPGVIVHEDAILSFWWSTRTYDGALFWSLIELTQFLIDQVNLPHLYFYLSLWPVLASIVVWVRRIFFHSFVLHIIIIMQEHVKKLNQIFRSSDSVWKSSLLQFKRKRVWSIHLIALLGGYLVPGTLLNSLLRFIGTMSEIRSNIHLIIFLVIQVQFSQGSSPKSGKTYFLCLCLLFCSNQLVFIPLFCVNCN